MLGLCLPLKVNERHYSLIRRDCVHADDDDWSGSGVESK